jgi:hypothetical protein
MGLHVRSDRLKLRRRQGELTRRVIEDRMGALERFGARMFVERLRFDWRPGTRVLPAHRGNGYIDEILGAGSRFLRAPDAPRSRAATRSA